MKIAKDAIKKASAVYNKALYALTTVAIVAVAVNFADRPQPEVKDDVLDPSCSQTAEEFLEKPDNSALTTATELSLVDYENEIFHSQLAKNSIPPVNNPVFTNYAEMDNCLKDDELVVVVSKNDETKIYPKTILDNHIVVNDFIADEPIAITGCAVCHSFAVYVRKFEGNQLRFGTSGKLYRNNDLLYDERTETLWTQFDGQAIVGSLIGARLDTYPYKVMTYNKAKASYPAARVMSFDTGFRSDYLAQNTLAFEASDVVYGRSINERDDLALKQLVYGFSSEDKVYAVAADEIGQSFKSLAGDRELTMANQDGEVIATLDNEPTPLQQAYWYVWVDFYPETILLKSF